MALTIAEAFACVPSLVKGTYFDDASLNDIATVVEENGGTLELRAPQPIDGSHESVEVRLNIDVKTEKWTSWSVSLKVNNHRISGVDFEASYRDESHAERVGWHRHVWHPDVESCERFKMAIEGLDGVSSRQQFLQRALKFLHVTLSGVDRGTDELLFT